jgi:hypothetical protein
MENNVQDGQLFKKRKECTAFLKKSRRMHSFLEKRKECTAF